MTLHARLFISLLYMLSGCATTAPLASDEVPDDQAIDERRSAQIEKPFGLQPPIKIKSVGTLLDGGTRGIELIDDQGQYARVILHVTSLDDEEPAPERPFSVLLLPDGLSFENITVGTDDFNGVIFLLSRALSDLPAPADRNPQETTNAEMIKECLAAARLEVVIASHATLKNHREELFSRLKASYDAYAQQLATWDGEDDDDRKIDLISDLEHLEQDFVLAAARWDEFHHALELLEADVLSDE